jgi:hypothetical protein
VQCLPIPFKLVGIAMRAKIIPDVFDRHIQSTLQQIVGNLRPSVREAIAFPV